jgi:hypothetical protein
MRNRIVVPALAVALIAILGFATIFQPRTQAQDDMMTTHVCDSTLILMLYIAEYDYGFESMMDLSTFEKGQFKPLFEAMMTMMDDDMMDDDMTGDDMMDDDMMDDDMTGDDMMDDDMMVILLPGHIEGEDMACTALREEVEDFLTKAIKESTMMKDRNN